MAYREQQGWGFCYQGVLWAGVSFPGCGSLACLHLPCYQPPAEETCLCVCRLWVCICEQGLAFWALILNEMENTLSTASASCVYVVGQSSRSCSHLGRMNGLHWV